MKQKPQIGDLVCIKGTGNMLYLAGILVRCEIDETGGFFPMNNALTIYCLIEFGTNFRVGKLSSWIPDVVEKYEI